MICRLNAYGTQMTIWGRKILVWNYSLKRTVRKNRFAEMNRTSTHTHLGAFFSFVSRSRWRRYCRDWAAARLNRSFSLNHRGRSDPNRPTLAAQLCEITPTLRYSTWDPIALNRLFFHGKCSCSSLCLVH